MKILHRNKFSIDDNLVTQSAQIISPTAFVSDQIIVHTENIIDRTLSTVGLWNALSILASMSLIMPEYTMPTQRIQHLLYDPLEAYKPRDLEELEYLLGQWVEYLIIYPNSSLPAELIKSTEQHIRKTKGQLSIDMKCTLYLLQALVGLNWLPPFSNEQKQLLIADVAREFAGEFEPTSSSHLIGKKLIFGAAMPVLTPNYALFQSKLNELSSIDPIKNTADFWTKLSSFAILTATDVTTHNGKLTLVYEQHEATIMLPGQLVF